MKCGDGVALCGVLTLETGLGKGNYRHPEPVVHGLWPQTGHYGSSKCIRPDVNNEPKRIYSCYDQQGQSHRQLEGFQEHEWQKHGTCAGVDDASDYFRQVCDLSAAPLQVMKDARAGGHDLPGIARALMRAGFHVWDVEEKTSEVHLSACATTDGDWKLAAAEQFRSQCGQRGGEDTATRCEPSRHGPPCGSDADCHGHAGCVRCAKSGYCTTQPVDSFLHRSHDSHKFEPR